MLIVLQLKGILPQARLLLHPRPTWPAEVAQRLIGEALRRTLERYARFVLGAALGLWLASLVLPTLGLR